MRSAAHEEAQQLVESASMSAQQLLEGKREDPISAVIGGFVLARLGLGKQLSPWAERLYEFRSWLADGIVLRAIQVGLEGTPKDCVQLLTQLDKSTLPVLTDALVRALDLMRIIPFLKPDDLKNVDVDSLNGPQSRLGRIAEYADLSEPTLYLRDVPVSTCRDILGTCDVPIRQPI